MKSLRTLALWLRAHLSVSLPAVVGTVIGLFIFDENLVIRVPVAVFFGFMIQTVALLAYGLACHVVLRLDGEESEMVPFEWDNRTTAAVLLAVSVYGMGMYWKQQQARTILACAREETRSTTGFGQFDNAEDLISYCVEEYGGDDSSASDD